MSETKLWTRNLLKGISLKISQLINLDNKIKDERQGKLLVCPETNLERERTKLTRKLKSKMMQKIVMKTQKTLNMQLKGKTVKEAKVCIHLSKSTNSRFSCKISGA